MPPTASHPVRRRLRRDLRQWRHDWPGGLVLALLLFLELLLAGSHFWPLPLVSRGPDYHTSTNGISFFHIALGTPDLNRTDRARTLTLTRALDIELLSGPGFHYATVYYSHTLRAAVPLLLLILAAFALRRGFSHDYRFYAYRSYLARLRQRRRAFAAGPPLCPACHYDLRASPTQCPECGTPVPAPESPPTPDAPGVQSTP